MRPVGACPQSGPDSLLRGLSGAPFNCAVHWRCAASSCRIVRARGRAPGHLLRPARASGPAVRANCPLTPTAERRRCAPVSARGGTVARPPTIVPPATGPFVCAASRPAAASADRPPPPARPHTAPGAAGSRQPPPRPRPRPRPRGAVHGRMDLGRRAIEMSAGDGRWRWRRAVQVCQ